MRRFVIALLTGLLTFTAVPAGAQEPDSADPARTDAVSIGTWIDDLSHPELARREAAVRALISAGADAAARVRPLCASPDERLALLARRIFGATHGVTPEVYGAVNGILADVRAGHRDVRAAATAIREISPAAQALALRTLDRARGKNRPHSPLYVELDVRRAIDTIASGADRDDRAHATVLAHGPNAADILIGIARDRSASRDRRSHAVWLYSLVSGPQRAAGLAPLVGDRDAMIRREAAVAVAETLRAEDMRAVAGALGTAPSAERDLLTAAAARSLEPADLEDRLASRSAAEASFAALAIGKQRGDDAYETLNDRLDSETRAEVSAAIATALGEIDSDEASERLAALYAADDQPAVRAAAITALRPRSENRRARIALTAALFDPVESIRLTAADALIGRANRADAPALIHAATGDSSQAVRARLLGGLAGLVPDGPRAGADTSAWSRWLRNNSDEVDDDSLPWFRSSTDADRIVKRVRSYIARQFYYFEKPELVEKSSLNRAATERMKKLFDSEAEVKDPIEVEGFERQVLRRLLNAAGDGRPDAFLAWTGVIPFESSASDLIRLTNAAAGGMVASLGDRFSRLSFSNDAEGNIRPSWLPGIIDDSDKSNGFYADEKDGAWWVEFVLYDSPAYYAGIRPGDQLVKIGKKFTGEMTRVEVTEAINTEAEFSILREGWNRPYAFAMSPVRNDSSRIVTSAVLPGKIGYLRLKMFEAACSVKIEKALVEMERDGIIGLVLDLRNNPGGTVVDATEIVDKFLPAGKLISINVTRDEDGDDVEEEVRATDASTDREYPLAVLINHSSASASEMTSGSLQGNQRAVVIGETSYGKGIGQSSTNVPGFASETALGSTRSVYGITLTMMRYYLPEGKRSIHHIGVEPDLPVRNRSLRGSLLDKVMRVRNGKDLDRYVTRLLDEQRDTAIALAVFDGKDTSRYPDWEPFAKKARRHVTEQEARRIVRAEIRRRLLLDRESEDFPRIFYDLQEDRALRAGIRAVAEEADVALEEHEEYSTW